MKIAILLVVVFAVEASLALQAFEEEPQYHEVNPGGSVVLPCIVVNIGGECRWEKDGDPSGMFEGKYEWAGDHKKGDCSLRIFDAALEYDNAVWQCSVTPSSFRAKDALTSQGAQLVVRERPTSISVQRVGDAVGNVTARAGEQIELECTVEGANPPPKIQWFSGDDKKIISGHEQRNDNEGQFRSVSRLTLPVSREDNGAVVSCKADHPTLQTPLSDKTTLSIHYAPVVKIETSDLSYLESNKDDVKLLCIADSNPPSSIIWRKDDAIYSTDPELHFSPVSRHTAGIFSCTAENALGLSEKEYIELDIMYEPVILNVGPVTRAVSAVVGKEITLTCEAEGNPKPKYQWLQKLPTQEVRICGYEKTLRIPNVTYDHQGEFVCKATNHIHNSERTVQSDPIKVDVSGAPRVQRRYSDAVKSEVRVRNGQDAVLKVLFCADPLPDEKWHLGDQGSGTGNNIILASGTGHGRFIAEKAQPASQKGDKCYVSTLRINGAHRDDSHSYKLHLSNNHGEDYHVINLDVSDIVFTNEITIAVIVGSILTFLLFILILIYCCKADRCCRQETANPKKEFKPTDLESDRTDVESTHSSNLSGFPEKNHQTHPQSIPPDALYATSEKAVNKNNSYVSANDALFNDSKESLRPDIMYNSNLNRTNSSSGELHLQQRISYNDLCFPKTSNYGSMKKKKQRQNVGVDCRLNNAALSYRPAETIYPYYS